MGLTRTTVLFVVWTSLRVILSPPVSSVLRGPQTPESGRPSRNPLSFSEESSPWTRHGCNGDPRLPVVGPLLEEETPLTGGSHTSFNVLEKTSFWQRTREYGTLTDRDMFEEWYMCVVSGDATVLGEGMWMKLTFLDKPHSTPVRCPLDRNGVSPPSK